MDLGKSRLLLLLVVLAGLSLMLWGCPKKAELAQSPESQATTAQPADEAEALKRAAEQKATEAAAKEKQAQEEAARAEQGMMPIHFDFDRATIRGDAEAVLQANGEWLKAHPTATVLIEGNCDERGTIEYNQALGQRRAVSAKRYLTDLGISAKRISLISYGKEKPICAQSAEDCWQKNRRDDFVVTAK